jgi:lysyl-tRNA synthetase class 1
MYEFIMLKGKGAMHSSKGTALSSDEMLKMTPPEVLRFLIMKNQPSKHIMFDPGFGLLSLVDEYDSNERAYFGVDEETRGMKDLSATYELSQPYTIPKSFPAQVPYRHLVTVVQIGTTWKDIKAILLRTGQIPEDIKKEDEERLRLRTLHAQYWLKNFAPESICFTIQKKIPKMTLDKNQMTFLEKLTEQSTSLSWEAEALHNAIYEAAQQAEISVKLAFTTIYQVLLGQEKGPRAGYFLSNLDKDFVQRRFKEALK